MAQHHPFFLWLMLGLLLVAGPVRGSSGFNRNLQVAYQEIVKLKIDSGRRILQEEMHQNPDNLATYLLQDYPDFLRVVITQEESLYRTLLHNQEIRLEKIKKSREQTPYRLYAQAEIRIHQALCQFFFDDEIQGVWNIRQAFLLLEENQKLYPGFYPNRKSLGLLQFALGSVPDSYHWILSILGMKASVKSGFQNLKLAADNPHPFQLEARLQYHFLEDMLHREAPGPENFFTGLAKSNPDNLLFSFLAVSILQKRKQCDEALVFFQGRPQGPAYLPVHFLNHMAADMYLFRGDYNRSITENNYFLKNYRGRHFVKDAYFKMYLAAWLHRDQVAANGYLQQIGQKGDDFVEEDANANKFYHRPQVLNPTLMKARLHTDGGYFKLAEQTLTNFDPEKASSGRDRTEYYYRRARIYHGQKNLAAARTYYLKTIQMAGSSPFYFAPNSALQLGYMALENKNVPEARAFFRKALSYPDHEYKRSIDSKAKVALGAL